MSSLRPRHVAIAAVALCAIASLAACESKVPVPPAQSTYVAFGSSFGAGSGIPTTTGSCARSNHNYPSLVAAALNLRLVDVTCSGARLANVVDTSFGAAPPQINAVTADTRLITMTIGGNDIDYASTAMTCGTTPASCPTEVRDLEARATALTNGLVDLIGTLRTRAPSATVVIVGYPRLVPDEACAALNYSPAAASLVRSVGERLEVVFSTAATTSGAKFADPYSVPGHGPCEAPGTKWINGATFTDGAIYHPTTAGHVGMADLVLDLFDRPAT